MLLAVFKMKFQFIVETGRGKEYKKNPHRSEQVCYTRCDRVVQVGPHELGVMTQDPQGTDLCALATLMLSLSVLLDLP